MTGMELFLGLTAAAATATTVVGQVQQGKAVRAANRANQQIAQQQAATALDQAHAQALQDAQDNRRRMGQIAAAYAAAGVDMEGSPLAVMSDMAAQGELTRQLTLYRGRIGAAGYSDQAALYGMQARSAGTATALNAGATLLGGASRIAGLYAASRPASQVQEFDLDTFAQRRPEFSY